MTSINLGKVRKFDKDNMKNIPKIFSMFSGDRILLHKHHYDNNDNFVIGSITIGDVETDFSTLFLSDKHYSVSLKDIVTSTNISNDEWVIVKSLFMQLNDMKIKDDNIIALNVLEEMDFHKTLVDISDITWNYLCKVSNTSTKPLSSVVEYNYNIYNNNVDDDIISDN